MKIRELSCAAVLAALLAPGAIIVHPIPAAAVPAVTNVTVAAAATALHVTLLASTPAADEALDSAPSHVRVLFSGRVEPRYSTLAVFAPDGSRVAIGAVVFAESSDREFMAAMPPITAAGRYTVQWRTAGADGHVLEGSWSFVLAGDTAAAAVDTLPVILFEPAVAVHGHEQHHDDGGAGEVLPVAARWLQFIALTVLLGAIAFRMLLLPRIAVEQRGWRDMQRRSWRVLAVAALLLAVAAVLRLWLQSAALHGVESAWDSALLSVMLTDTNWGRAWLLQAFFFAVLGAGIAAARPGRDTIALGIVVPAAVGLAAIPALSGHAAGAAGTALLAVVNDTLHVLGVGAWIGTLALVLVAALPSLRRLDSQPDAAVAGVVDRFPPLALAAATLVAVTGVINAVMHMSDVAQLLDTAYGRTLLAKLAAVLALLAAGFYHWRFVRPRLGDALSTRRFRYSVAAELLLAAAVLLVTAILTGQQRP